MTPEELLKLAKEYLDYPQAKSLRTGWQDAVSFAEGYLALSVKLEENIGPPGHWICSTCGFVLMKMKIKLRASDMAVGVDVRDVQDVCPNDGSSMRRKTWKEDALDSDRVGREQMALADSLRVKLEAAEQERDDQKDYTQDFMRQVRVLQAKVAGWEALDASRGAVVKPLSGQPCGCDPAANWTCERHSTMPLEHK